MKMNFVREKHQLEKIGMMCKPEKEPVEAELEVLNNLILAYGHKKRKEDQM
jgi:hypothetical protein